LLNDGSVLSNLGVGSRVLGNEDIEKCESSLEKCDSSESIEGWRWWAPDTGRIFRIPVATSATPFTGFLTAFNALGSLSTQSGMQAPVRRLQNDLENEQQFLASIS